MKFGDAVARAWSQPGHRPGYMEVHIKTVYACAKGRILQEAQR